MNEDRSGWEGELFADLDWYARDLSGEEYRACTFRDVDLSEAVSRGATFESCVFDSCRMNASTHTSSAFVAHVTRGDEWVISAGPTTAGCGLRDRLAPPAPATAESACPRRVPAGQLACRGPVLAIPPVSQNW